MPIAADLALVVCALALLPAAGLALPVLARHAGGFDAQPRKAQALGTAMVAGLLFNHAAALIVADLRLALLATAAMAAASLAWAAREPRFLSGLLRLGWPRSLLAVGLVLVFSVPILLQPLQAWDARSIWFFQAKRIYYDGGLDLGRDWVDPAYAFSHLDYPKLLPMLAAQFASLAGFWNEYVPKASLLALLIPVVLGMIGAAGALNLRLAFLAVTFLLGGGELMWNGYADAYYALYAGMALVFWGRWLREGAALDLVSALAYLGVVANLKNEGSLLVLCVCAGLVCFAPRVARILRGERTTPAVWLALVLPATGYVALAFAKQRWAVPNDLALGLGSIARALERVGDGGLVTIAQAFASQPTLAAGVVAFLLAALLAAAVGIMPPAACFPALVATLYLAGIFLIYLSTPQDLKWHLSTSADRTLLAAAYGFVAAAFLALGALGSGQRGPRGAVAA